MQVIKDERMGVGGGHCIFLSASQSIVLVPLNNVKILLLLLVSIGGA